MARISDMFRKDGTKYYRVQVRVKGYPSTSACFDRITDAKNWAQKTEYEMKSGIHFGDLSTRRMSLSELIDRYICNYLPTKEVTEKSKLAQIHRLYWWKQEIGNVQVKHIKPSLLTQCKEKLSKVSNGRGKKYSPDTVNYYLGSLSHVFTVACNEWELIPSNPMLKVKKAKKPRGRVRYLCEMEIEKLLAACMESQNPHLYTIVILALSTGARKSEILTLTRKQVSTKNRRIILEDTKNGERRQLPLQGKALEVMKEHMKIASLETPLLFPGKVPSKPTEIKRAWQYALTRARIEDFRFHDLRHTAASYLAMNGARLMDIAEILGHKTLAMVKKYAHLSEDHKAEVVRKMNERLFG